jgi:uncharacterized protein
MRPVVSIRIDEDLLTAARRRAKQQHRSLTNYIEKLVADDLRGDGFAEAVASFTPQRNLDRVLHILRAHQPELRAMGVLHAGVYGSVARGEETAASDVDVLVEVDKERIRDLFDYGGVQDALQRWLGGDIDVKDRGWMKPDFLARIMKDHVNAF